MNQLQRLAYEAKYTVGAYTDAIMTLPILAGQGVAKGIEKLLGDRTPEFLTAEHAMKNSGVVKAREKLRDKLDTKPGTLYLGAGLISTVPFFGAGIPMAEFAQNMIQKYAPHVNEIAQAGMNSLATLTAQIVTGYSSFMASEVILNRPKYVDSDNKLVASKLGTCFKNTLKTWLFFDLAYVGAKLAGQSYMLMQGKDPWIATSLFDSIALPASTALSVMLGIRGGLIETRDTKAIKSQ